MALGTTDRYAKKVRLTALPAKGRVIVQSCCCFSVLTAISLFLLLLGHSGCAPGGRSVAKNAALSEEKTSAKESRLAALEERTPPKPAPPGEKGGGQEVRPANRQHRSGQTDLETVRDIAIDLAKNHAPVEKMLLCYVKKNDEWWITLFQSEDHALDLKRYIWNKREDKVEPFCVVKRIARDALPDYLNEQRQDRTCTAFAHSTNGWTSVKTKSSMQRYSGGFPDNTSTKSGSGKPVDKGADIDAGSDLRDSGPSGL
jgi:hypothetical protein